MAGDPMRELADMWTREVRRYVAWSQDPTNSETVAAGMQLWSNAMRDYLQVTASLLGATTGQTETPSTEHQDPWPWPPKRGG